MARQQKAESRVKVKHIEISKVVKCDKGYTYLEALLCLSMLLIFIPTTFLIKDTLYKEFAFVNNKNGLNNQLLNFKLCLKRELATGYNFDIVNNNLCFDTAIKERITYMLKGKELIRQVNNKGHTKLLDKVKEIQFSIKNEIISTNVTLENSGVSRSFVTTIGGRLFVPK